jgi:predicted nucleotidyltransferase
MAVIDSVLERLKNRYNPVSVWLFGSRARGDYRPDSDWDIMVVIDDSAPDDDLDLREAHRQRKGTGVAADIVPIRHGDFLEDLWVAGALPHEVAKDGVLLHERRKNNR